MKYDNIGKIIEFAVEREKEAAEFYRNLQSDAHFESKRKLLKSLEEMELSHIEKLNEIKSHNIKEIENYSVEDLKISDYIVENHDRGLDDLTYQDILIIAMKKEESAYKLYKNLAEKLNSSFAGKVFGLLASEEASHKKHFEEIYDNEILKEN